MAGVQGVLLDVGGVVLQPGLVMVNRLAATIPPVAALLEPWGGAGGPGDLRWQLMLAGRLTERRYWADLSAQILARLGVGAGASATDPTRSLMQQLYRGPEQDYVRPDVVTFMQEVRDRGIPLGALTNDLADFHGQEWVAEQSWLRLFDTVVDGSVSGVLKPAPAAYAAGAAALGLAPATIAYLDDLPGNVAAGQAAGLQAILVAQHDAGPAVARARALLEW